MPQSVDETFDKVDLAILSVLQRDGRAPFSAVAKEVDLPESTVRLRTKKILDSGLVSVVATGNPLELGVPVDAVSLIYADSAQISEVVHTLVAMLCVRYVAVTLGGRVLITESFHQDTRALHDFLSVDLHNISGVEEVEMFQVMEIHKSIWDWQAWLAAGKSETTTGAEKESK